MAMNYAFENFVAGKLTIAFSNTITGTQSGPYTVAPGQSVQLAPGSTVTGPLTVQAGGSLQAAGATISGPLTASSASAIRICNSTLSAPTTISGSSGLVVLGDDDGDSACAGNTFGSPVKITNNSAGVEFDDDTVNAPLTITGNTGSLGAPDSGAVDTRGSTAQGKPV